MPQKRPAPIALKQYIEIDKEGNIITPYLEAIADIQEVTGCDYMMAREEVENKWPDASAQHDRLMRAIQAGRPDLLSDAIETSMASRAMTRRAEVLAALAKSENFSDQLDSPIAPGTSFSTEAQRVAKQIVSASLTDSDLALLKEAAEYKRAVSHDPRNARPGSLLVAALGLRSPGNSPTGA